MTGRKKKAPQGHPRRVAAERERDGRSTVSGTTRRLPPIELPPEPAACLYCGGELREKTNEHIFPRWLLAEFGVEKEVVTGTWEDHRSGTVVDTRVQALQNLVAGRVCANCNNGWMSDLENETKPILLPLVRRRRLLDSLRQDERQVLARWSLKTAAALNSSSNYRRLVPKRHRRALVAGPPRDDVMVLAHQGATEHPLRWLQTQNFTGWGDAGYRRQAAEAGRRCYRVAFSIGHVLVLVAYWPRSDDDILLNGQVHVPLWPERATWRVQDVPTTGFVGEKDLAVEMIASLISFAPGDAREYDLHRFWRR